MGIKWSRGAHTPSGGVGCASRPTCRQFHRPAAAFFFNSACGGACWCTRGRARSPRPWRCCAFGEAGMSGLGSWRRAASPEIFIAGRVRDPSRNSQFIFSPLGHPSRAGSFDFPASAGCLNCDFSGWIRMGGPVGFFAGDAPPS